MTGESPNFPNLMLVGETPGKTESETYIPFSRQVGKELMQTHALVRWTREDIYITSAVRSRPYHTV